MHLVAADDATVISVQGVYLGGKQVAALLGRLHFEILRGVRGVRDGWARVLQPHEEGEIGVRGRRAPLPRAKQLQGCGGRVVSAKREHALESNRRASQLVAQVARRRAQQRTRAALAAHRDAKRRVRARCGHVSSSSGELLDRAIRCESTRRSRATCTRTARSSRRRSRTPAASRPRRPPSSSRSRSTPTRCSRGLFLPSIRERRLQRVRVDQRRLSVASKTAIDGAPRRSTWMDWSRLRELERGRRRLVVHGDAFRFGQDEAAGSVGRRPTGLGARRGEL